MNFACVILWLFSVWNIFWTNCVCSQYSPFSVPCLQYSSLEYRNSRIVGGNDVMIGETPYIVSLTRRGGHFCGATVLNHRWLLTAGHCICNGLNKIMKPTQIKAVLGLHRISDYKDNAIDTEAYETDLKAIIPHDNYKCTLPANDIALLELYKPIKFTDSIKPACISLNTDNTKKYIDQVAVVSGWGWTNEDQTIGERADTLQKAVVNIWDNENCQKSFDEHTKGHTITETQLCAGYTNGGIDACWADSGGPLTTNKNVLIGVVSTGVGCARPGLPGIYTRVSEFVDWIKTVIEQAN